MSNVFLISFANRRHNFGNQIVPTYGRVFSVDHLFIIQNTHVDNEQLNNHVGGGGGSAGSQTIARPQNAELCGPSGQAGTAPRSGQDHLHTVEVRGWLGAGDESRMSRAGLSSISSSRLVSRFSSSRDSTRLCPARYPGIGSASLRRLSWTWFGLVFVAACNQKNNATSSGSMLYVCIFFRRIVVYLLLSEVFV